MICVTQWAPLFTKALYPINWKTAKPIPRASVTTINCFALETFPDFAALCAPNNTKLLSIIIAVLIKNAMGRSTFTQKLSPIETMYAEVNPANIIHILTTTTQTKLFLTLACMSLGYESSKFFFITINLIYLFYVKKKYLSITYTNCIKGK